MSSDIQKSIKTTEKLANDSIYDTNWCDMPSEIKAKCIGKMEFKERLSLRSTAKAERSLVDSQKIKFQKGVLMGELDNGDFEVSLDSENGNTVSFKTMKDRLELMKYIWKVGVFEELNVSISPLFGEEEAPAMKEKFIGNTSEISAKNVGFGHCDTDIILYILRNTKNGVESIEMNAFGNPHPFDDILAIPQVQNTKYWHIEYHNQTDALHKVAQVWIDNNSSIGSTFQLSIDTNVSFDDFKGHFTERIITTSTKRARISTNNPDHHILLERGWNPYGVYFRPQFFRLTVISADMKESDYDDNCKEWIRKLDPYFFNNWENNVDDDPVPVDDQEDFWEHLPVDDSDDSDDSDDDQMLNL
ncbi:hypothetical protein B9Z55_008548 [Caenorhabditis nigoni]|uniref:F-box domain-containing protein n=1 Tax=Caenorhabditis nigoni TaxID=1611254 RepID=A0A2G5UN70_9PELO|nr:hypothetical protein B9Z55_008548 [Caenorhabditis nigoni]